MPLNPFACSDQTAAIAAEASLAPWVAATLRCRSCSGAVCWVQRPSLLPKLLRRRLLGAAPLVATMPPKKQASYSEAADFWRNTSNTFNQFLLGVISIYSNMVQQNMHILQQMERAEREAATARRRRARERVRRGAVRVRPEPDEERGSSYDETEDDDEHDPTAASSGGPPPPPPPAGAASKNCKRKRDAMSSSESHEENPTLPIDKPDGDNPDGKPDDSPDGDNPDGKHDPVAKSSDKPDGKPDDDPDAKSSDKPDGKTNDPDAKASKSDHDPDAKSSDQPDKPEDQDE